MRNVPSTIREQLEEIFDSRVTFDPVERRLYSHDVGVFPRLVRPIIGNTMPAAVVRPHDEEELLELVRVGNSENIPLLIII